ncbi:DNA-binding response regulator, OmpR family, contains REC and winged-helix (wHTH) domain [Alteribacillus persepolensis]|uniref:DNA-binding response regulator, OmpR family, contains REC and winged-helix (WHTH) domain n=1 Tax=Alteribacillus persepolensis TaxID=568899 RepID=A0A1G8ETY6_9BACI|nr:response regulator transcription factor [Alteribacillus persepolensis]SDH73287.1 DNA-binding response regulator, OmpR family, contains REC and winged-helix (wHTH) domain [Alteribacillus persepolensis]
MPEHTILVIEDEEKLARVLTLELEYEGYAVQAAYNGKDGLEEALTGSYDLLLLDVMLPEMSGMEILRRFRRRHQHTPVIMLTAKDEVSDKVSGLDLGANDYVTKPFETEELLARIRAQLRTNTANTAHSAKVEVLTIDTLTVHVNTRDIIREDRHIEVTPREFDLLVYFLRNKNQVLTRDQLLESVWGFDYAGDTNVVDVYIRYLRKKIDTGFSTPLIHTVRGVGYQMKGT